MTAGQKKPIFLAPGSLGVSEVADIPSDSCISGVVILRRLSVPRRDHICDSVNSAKQFHKVISFEWFVSQSNIVYTVNHIR